MREAHIVILHNATLSGNMFLSARYGNEARRTRTRCPSFFCVVRSSHEYPRTVRFVEAPAGVRVRADIRRSVHRWTDRASGRAKSAYRISRRDETRSEVGGNAFRLAGFNGNAGLRAIASHYLPSRTRIQRLVSSPSPSSSSSSSCRRDTTRRDASTCRADIINVPRAVSGYVAHPLPLPLPLAPPSPSPLASRDARVRAKTRRGIFRSCRGLSPPFPFPSPPSRPACRADAVHGNFVD